MLTRGPDASSAPGTAQMSARRVAERVCEARLSDPRVRTTVVIPIRHGIRARFVTFDGLADQGEHFALCFGESESVGAAPLVRVHSECITGDVFGSLRCDCGAQLDRSIEMLHVDGGILLYLRQEGRGLGLLTKLDSYRLQDRGLDTFDANRALLHPDDARSYVCGAEMLRALGVTSVRLMTNNPDKVDQLRQAGIEIVECVPAGTFLTPFNRPYLLAKAQRAGHRLDL